MNRIDAESTSIACAVLRYFLLHPTAQDSLDGIQQWLSPAPPAARSELERTLESLAAKAWVMRSRDARGHVVYRLNRESAAQIENFLRSRRP